jgi:nucleotide-binding universal stress UspA family protein
MTDIRVVLCPLDFSAVSGMEVALATEVCETFGANLVLHHNLVSASPGLTRVWEWNEVRRGEPASEAHTAEGLQRALRALPKTFSAEARITSGPPATAMMELATRLPADLIILGSHGWSTPDHASLTERILDGSSCPVLTVNESAEAAACFHLGRDPKRELRVAVPVDLSDASKWPLAYAFALARRLPTMQLDLLHVVEERSVAATRAARGELDASVPLDMSERTRSIVLEGDPIDEIVRFTARAGSAFLVMGEHARGLLRRLFTRNTANGVLHRALCPVWFVPPRGEFA